MKRLTSITILIIAFAFSLSGQVSINTTGNLPDESAMLDISSSNSGILIPRVALSGRNDNTTIPLAIESLLIYNTTSNSDLRPGFYFWSGSYWSEIITSENQGAFYLQFGGNVDVGKFAAYNGTVNSSAVGSNISTRGVFARGGYITTISFYATNDDPSIDLVITSNGGLITTSYTIDLSGSGVYGSVDLPTPILVVQGDYMEITSPSIGIPPGKAVFGVFVN
ncbi:MAG: hypothetical protein HQ565_10820 [Bacteroidetes bacterium]|nr:hypothetical protein [Bacteroidota bacterium]